MSFVGGMTRKLGLRWLGGRKDTLTSQDLMAYFNAGGLSRSGSYVNWQNAVCVSAVLGCVRVIAEDLAKVPLKLYLADGVTKTPAFAHPLYNLVGRRPNSWMTGFEFREMLIASAVLSGNGYAYVTRGADGQPLELLPLPPSNVQVRRPVGTWDIVYTVTLPNGGGTITVPQANMLHLRGVTLDGLIGADIVRLAREAIGLSMATEEQQAKFARGGLKSAGVLETDQSLTADQIKQLTELWTKEWGGASNADKTPILYNGLKFNAVSTSNKDAEMILLRTFQVEEIARVFRVYPILIGSSSGLSSRSSITDIFAAHVSHCLQPWAARLEQALDNTLLTEKELNDGYYFQVVLQGLLRGDTAARAQYYHTGITDGWLTRNEARGLEEMDPLPGLEDPLQPLNMLPVGADADADDQNPPPRAIGGNADNADAGDNAGEGENG